MNIYLIGYRCTGKTAVSKRLGELLGRPVLDSDEELVAAQKRTIQEIVATDGWDAFRQMEAAVMARLATLENHVIATGGGVVLNDANIASMRAGGRTVWLRATPQTILKRMQADASTEANRPALTDRSLAEEIEDTLAFREPLYEKAMDLEIHTDTLSIDAVSRSILDRLRAQRNGGRDD